MFWLFLIVSFSSPLFFIYLLPHPRAGREENYSRRLFCCYLEVNSRKTLQEVKILRTFGSYGSLKSVFRALLHNK